MKACKRLTIQTLFWRSSGYCISDSDKVDFLKSWAQSLRANLLSPCKGQQQGFLPFADKFILYPKDYVNFVVSL